MNSLRTITGRVIVIAAIAALLAIPAALTDGGAHAKAPEKRISLEIKKGEVIRLPRPAASIMIADPEIADIEVKSPSLLYLYGKRVGETTLYALDDQEQDVMSVVVTVTHNLSSLKKTIRGLFPDHKLRFRSVDGAMVVEGTASSPDEAQKVQQIASSYLQEGENLLNMMSVTGSDQVMLRVRIAEVARSELKEFGINLESILNSGSFVFGVATGRDFIDDTTGAFVQNATTDSIFVNYEGRRGDINGVIDALEDEGMVSILAEPNLTALSGQPASFLAGGEFPIPVVGEESSVTIDYREFGVSLRFTPTVLSKERIMLTVAPEVSTLTQVGSIQANGFDIPSLSTRRAETSVELGSGQSFAIAGLLQHDITNEISKYPGLGDVPILGALFRSTSFRNEETELVIIVTPYIVKGVNEAQLATPVDGLKPATDMQRVLLGKLYDDTQPAGERPSGTPVAKGNIGFVLE